MATSKKFSQLPAASSITNNDLAAIAHEDALAETGYESQKATMIQIGKKLLGDIEYVTDLPGFPSDEQNPFAALLYLRDSILDLLPVDEASGAVANFETDVVLPLIDVKAQIKAVETGTGAKSPSNPYVISGFTGMDLYQRGANLWDGQYEAGTYDQTTGEETPSTSLKRNITPIAVKPNTNYARVKTQEGSSLLACRMFYYDANMTLISTNVDTTDRAIITTPNNCAFVNFAFQNNISALSFNYPSSDTEIHAYNPNATVYPVSWQTEAGEVFGGEIDIKRGKLKVYPYYPSYNGETLSGKWLSSMDTYAAGTTPTIGAEVVDLSGAVYTEIDITPQEITPLVGTNNLWSDTNGNTTVKYKIGIQKYIDKKIAEVQALVL